MMKRDLRLSRRNLLKALGAGAALLPLLESDPADAACLVSGIKRLYIIAWPDGMLSNVSQWATAGATPAAWTLPAWMSSLQPYQSDLLLLHGLDYKFIRDQPNPGGGETNGHACFPGMLTGAFYQSLVPATSADVGGGISVDQYIGNQLQATGYKGLVSLNQGAFVKSTGRLSWKAAGQAVLPDADPYHIFSTYFAGQLPNTTPTPMPAVDAGAPAMTGPTVTQRMQKSILDYVINDLNRFSNIVGTEDKQRIANHLQSVRNLELTLTPRSGSGGGPIGDGGVTTSTSSACGLPAMDFTGTKLDINSTSNVEAIVKLQMDLAAAAFASDLTRVIVMQIADQGAANLILTNLGFKAGGQSGNTGDINGYHAIAHRNDVDKTTCDTWFQKQVASMIGRLKSITDPTGKSMLDSSVLVAMNNMRTGTHETTQVPVVMAGSCGGYFKTGRSLDLMNTPNNGLLVALCNAMGFPVATFGQAQYGGELTVLKG
ncbi:MAG: DUF1552 domain-containing protein [Myxococcota bacterium]|nr:DUF1552 domain-containing protein [Myxococcota bacterium]